MTIVQIIGLGAKKFGGLERYILELARQIEQRGDKLIIVFNAEPQTKEYIDKLATTNAEWVVISNENKWNYFKKLNLLFKKYKPEIVQTHFGDTLTIVLPWFIGLIYGVKKQFAYTHCEPTINSKRIRFAFNIILLISKKNFCVSQNACQILQDDFPNKKERIKTLYLGVEDFSYNKQDSREKYSLPTDKIIIGNVAYHNEIKGVDVLLKAIKIIKDDLRFNNFVLCQIGGGQTGVDTERLYLQAKELGIEKQIIWMGIQNNVPEILSACDIYCQPSRSEGIGLAIMEASLANLPVVASNVGGIPEVVTIANGILVESENPYELANALWKLLTDQDLRKELGSAGRVHAQNNFKLVIQVKKLIAEYYE